MSIGLFMLILCLDSFFASVSFTVSKIKCFRGLSVCIAFFGTLFLWLSFQLAGFLADCLVNPRLISGLLLIFLGMLSLGKRWISARENRVIRLHFKQVSILLEIVQDETKADLDKSKSLSIKEALYLAVALSLDSLASGFAFGLGLCISPIFFFCLFFLNILAVEGGLWLGEWLSAFAKKDISWISGLFFILLGISRL